MNRYLLAGLLSVLAMVTASGSDIPNTLTSWIGSSASPSASPTGSTSGPAVQPLEKAGQFVQRQAPVAADQTLGSTAQQTNSIPSSSNNLPSQGTSTQADSTTSSATQPPFSAPATVPGTGQFANGVPINSQTSTGAAPATPTTTQSLDSIPALW